MIEDIQEGFPAFLFPINECTKKKNKIIPSVSLAMSMKENICKVSTTDFYTTRQ